MYSSSGGKEQRGPRSKSEKCPPPAIGRSSTPARSRLSLIRECQSMVSVIMANTRDEQLTNQTNAPRQYEASKPLPIKQELDLNFAWCSDEFDVLNYYDLLLPAPFVCDPAILTRRLPNESEAEDYHRRMETSPAQKRRRICLSPVPSELTRLPKFYYTPWPQQTHKLPFPGEHYYKFAEATISKLVQYKTAEQDDDSVELGLRITAHIHRESTELTINPSTIIWHVLSRPGMSITNRMDHDLETVARDLRRRVSPYLSVNVGITKAFATMLVHRRHWYVVLIVGTDTLMQCLVKSISNVSSKIRPDFSSAQQLPRLYAHFMKELHPSKVDDIALVISESLGMPLIKSGWEMVRDFAFTCILHSLATYIHTARDETNLRIIMSLDTESQERHMIHATMEIVKQLLWPNRVYIPGPQQKNCVSCGAYALSTIWNLSQVDGLNNMITVVRKSLNKKRRLLERSHRMETNHILKVTFLDMYDDGYVDTVIGKFDSFVRTKVIKKT